VKEVLSLVLMFGVGFCCLVMVRLIWFQVSSHIECCWYASAFYILVAAWGCVLAR
jgi:hypothetical protein